MASPLDVTALLLYYRSRMEHDLHANTLLFDISTQCSLVCTHNSQQLMSSPPLLCTASAPSSSHTSPSLLLPSAAIEATLDSLLPPFSPMSLSSLSDCLPDPSTAPVRSARGRQCLDVCVSRYLDVSGYTRRRMGRTVGELIRMDRTREKRREREKEGNAVAVTGPAQVEVSGQSGAEGVG